jgi:hypothetical protein
MQNLREQGQATVLVMLAMSIFLLAAVGLATDGAHLYAQRQMAQAAADAAAQAGIMSIFDGTNGGSLSSSFGTGSSFNCTTADGKTPCYYARLNGFGGSASDTVTIDFPTSAPGVTLSGSDPVNLLRATVQRNVGMSFLRLVGPSTLPIKATATAAIVDVVAPVPIIVTHPTLAGALSSNGNPTVTICGGPKRSIQINSNNVSSTSMNSNTRIDLSHAGPLDPGNCSAGTGADFGDFGGPGSPTFTLNSGIGRYIQPASPILDPLKDVTPPTQPITPGSKTPLANGVNGCPASPLKACQLYSPGYWAGGIEVKNETAVFQPGIYYIDGAKGFVGAANSVMLMATAGVPDSITGTGWTANMMVYNTGTGQFDVGANGAVSLVGSPNNSAYKGILFFEDRTAPANIGNSNSHKLGGGGAISLVGTIYVTNTLGIMSDASHYQELRLQGTPGSSTLIQGEIIAGALTLGGNAGIQMNLNPDAILHVRQVALVH